MPPLANEKRVNLREPLLSHDLEGPRLSTNLGGLRPPERSQATSDPCPPCPGRLRVRCLGARDLRPFQVQIFSQGANSEPYVPTAGLGTASS